MGGFKVTRMSSKGQVVTPIAIRMRLTLKEGDQFCGRRWDVVILKRLFCIQAS